MFAYPTFASRSTIAARVAEWRRRIRTRSGLMRPCDRQFDATPFGPDEARLEAAHWYWLP